MATTISLLSSSSSSSSSTTTNPSINRRRKKKKIQTEPQPQNLATNSPIQWKSDSQQQIYSSKLLTELHQVRSSSAASPKRVRDAADRALASTAKGRSRWSRAILTNRLKMKFMKKNNIAKRERKVMTVISTGSTSRLRRKSKVSVMRLRSKGLPAVQRKGRVLGRMVPGCRKQPLPVVLEEVADYIPALEMQIRAMTAVLELVSVSGPTSSGSAGA